MNRRCELIGNARAIADEAEREERELTAEESAAVDRLWAEVDAIEGIGGNQSTTPGSSGHGLPFDPDCEWTPPLD